MILVKFEIMKSRGNIWGVVMDEDSSSDVFIVMDDVWQEVESPIRYQVLETSISGIML